MVQVDRPEGGTAPPTRTPADRGWSLDLAASRRLGATLTAVLVLSLLAPAAVLASGYDPSDDVNSMVNTTAYTGATAWWNAGYTGAGVDIALIDTGVSPVEGLATQGKIVYGPDLSLESQAEDLRNLDTNGHGTFMAGLIAGKGSDLTEPYAEAPASAYRGMAPDARIVSLKVGVADGGTDVSQVIAAIDWVVEHKDDNDLNIRVINLSYGTNSAQAYTVDPLAYAVEQAWKAGIFVVAAGGNYGYQSRRSNAPALANPAIDRYVMAVGSSDSMGTMTIEDDEVPEFSPWPRRGTTRSVNLVAPGVHIQGLRVRNSFIDLNHPEGVISGRYFRGSGTSESAAIVSGAAALLLQKYPSAKPDRIKKLLTSTGYEIVGESKAIGGGELDLEAALTAALPHSTQIWPVSTGTGSLEAARGQDHLTLDGVVLTGEQDIFGATFDSAAMADLEAAGNSWSGGTWNGNSWSGSSWSGNSWSGNSWSGSSWSGSSWSGNSWSGSSWSGNSWSGSSWSGSSWSGNSWSTAAWD